MGTFSPWRPPVALPRSLQQPSQNPRCIPHTRLLGCFFLGLLSPTSSPRPKYLPLKFGFQCASLLPVFNNILEDYHPAVVSATLQTADEHLFTLTFTPSVCVSAEETRQTLNEWEFTFLMILSNAIYNCGEGVVVNRGFIVGPRVPPQIILCQIPEERRQIDKVRENLVEDSGILADDPPPTNAAAAQVIHELEHVLSPQPSTSTSLEKHPKKPSRKNPFVKLIRL